MPKWTILELGTAVNLTTTFNESDILELINIYHLQDICNIPFEEALAISLRSKKMSDEKIYKNKIFNAFLNSSVEEDIPSLYEQRYKALLDLPITINVLQGQNKLLKVLQIFGITEAEYSLLLELNNLPGPKFDSESVAKCVRYIFTAKCLGVTLHELFYILKTLRR
ncbi:MAG: hypothetical protein IPL25_10245 [Saprospiraceae bacterium]|nr:hypothetical protein [Candidatus Vicinibacter affinis]